MYGRSLLPKVTYALDRVSNNSVTHSRINLFRRETDQLSEVQDEDLPHFMIENNKPIKQIKVQEDHKIKF
jgi:hypothetical protein